MAWDLFGSERRKKPRTASATQKMLFWDTHSHVCHICHKTITRISEAELDHVRAYAKGGATMKLAHRACNRAKSSKSLTAAQKYMGVRQTRKKAKKRRKRERSLWDISF